MRFIAVDWGTSRFRAYRIDGRVTEARCESEDGVSCLAPGQHREVFRRQCGAWLAAEPDLPTVLVGMVGSREGWIEAPYAPCPAGPAEIASALIAVDLGEGKTGWIVPGVSCEPAAGAFDVMRGEETHALGAGVDDGLICLPGTHCKWVEMAGGRMRRFATYISGELYALLRQHSMIGRPAAEPADPAGFDLGLAAADRNAGPERAGLTHLLFEARAGVVTGRLSPAALGPYLSGLLTGDEINAALAMFARPERVTIVADPPRADGYVEALARRGIATRVVGQEESLHLGLAAVLGAARRS